MNAVRFPADAPNGLELFAARLVLVRQAREQQLRGALEHAPAWEVALVLFAKGNRRPYCVTDVAVTAGLTVTSTIRQLRILAGQGIVEVNADPLDKRRKFVKLTILGERLVGNFLAGASKIMDPAH